VSRQARCKTFTRKVIARPHAGAQDHGHANLIRDRKPWIDVYRDYQIAALSHQGLRCVAYDRRGHGCSDKPGAGYNCDTLADDLSALLTQLDLYEVTLVSHSFGSAEAVRYLTRHGAGRIKRQSDRLPAGTAHRPTS
jgi:pimeloyl-ACP methyl ester carboxylesterase